MKSNIEAVVVAPRLVQRCVSGQPVSLSQAAREWGMSEAALRRRVKSGLIQAVRIGTAWKIEAATINAFLAARWCSKEVEDVP